MPQEVVPASCQSCPPDWPSPRAGLIPSSTAPLPAPPSIQPDNKRVEKAHLGGAAPAGGRVADKIWELWGPCSKYPISTHTPLLPLLPSCPSDPELKAGEARHSRRPRGSSPPPIWKQKAYKGGRGNPYQRRGKKRRERKEKITLCFLLKSTKCNIYRYHTDLGPGRRGSGPVKHREEGKKGSVQGWGGSFLAPSPAITQSCL